MNNKTKQLVISALMLAMGVVLPQAFHAIPNAGSIFLPMHIPVLVAGFAVGPVYGAIVGALTPVLSHLIFHMPPAAILGSMVCELCMYGFMTGLLSRIVKTENKIVKIFAVLIGAMLAGRVTYGILNALIFRAGKYSLQAWISAAFTTALPGIIIQLIVVPAVVFALNKANQIEL